MPVIVNGQQIQLTTVDTVVDSILTEVTEIEHHVHGTNKVYGIAGSAPLIMSRGSTTPLVVTGGTSATGTSMLLHTGTMDGEYYDPNKLQITAVGTANRPVYLEFYTATVGTEVATGTGETDDDTFTLSGHGLSNGDRFIFTALSSEANGVTTNIVYFARDIGATTFKVELTSGGGAVNITGDITGVKIKKLSSPTKVTEIMVSMAGTNVDSQPIHMNCDRLSSTKALWVVGTSTAAGTNQVDFFLDIHTYTS